MIDAGTSVVGERRQITALFYDIVGSTRLLGALDPEDFRNAQQRIHDAAAAAIQEYGGYVSNTQGDGGCAFFGVPVPAEDAAECAVIAGLDIVRRCRSASLDGIPLQIRVGIATGLVVLETTNDDRPILVGNIVGLAPNLASRAQAVAAPDSVLVSESTYQLTRKSFHYAFSGSYELKGIAEPQTLWCALRRIAADEKFSGVAPPLVPLVGRADELRLLGELWEDACLGRGQALLILGEPGIGKSRLLAEFRQRVDGSMHLFECQARVNRRALHPFLPMLEQQQGERSEESSAKDRWHVIDFLLEEEVPDHSAFNDLAQADVRRRIIGEMRGMIEDWASKQPQILVIEDLQWADSLTQALVSDLVDNISGLPVLLVLTARGPDRLKPDLGSVRQLVLQPLTDSDVLDLARAVWSPQPLPADVAGLVSRRSDGIPLFAEELSRFLLQRTTAPESPTHRDVLDRPSNVVSLQDLLAARLAQAGSARRLAQIASILGRDFTLPLLRELAQRDLPAQRFDDAASRLLEAKLIEPTGSEHYRFRHALLADAAYESLLRSERQELHQRLVTLARESDAFRLPSSEMAWHCEHAGLLLEAVEFGLEAAEACSAKGAATEAENLLKRAELLLQRSTASPATKENLRIQLLAILGPVAVALHGSGSAEARSVYEEGVALCQTRTAEDRESWFPLYWGWWFTAPDFELQRQRSQTIAGDLESATDPEVRLQAFHCAWATEFNAGNHRECLCRIEKGLALYDPNRAARARIRYGGHDAKVCGLGERGLAEWFVGREHEAVRSVEEALAWAEETDHVGSICHILDIALMLQFCRRDLGQVRALADRTRSLAETHALSALGAKAKIFRGWANGVEDPTGGGLDELEAGLSLLERIGTEEDFPVYHEMQAELLGLRGQIEPALALVDRTIDRASAAGHLFWVPELFRRRAMLRGQRGDPPQACLDDLERARALAERQGATTLVARAQGEAARMGGSPGQPG
jgi:predicted ATPase/class 3 adenylate cyclase